MVLVSVMIGRLSTNSRNSSKPPSADPNRQKISRKRKNPKSPGGQKGHVGTTLAPVEDPDEVITLSIDRRTLDKNTSYQAVGIEKRQIIDIDIQRFVTEYQAQVLEDDQGNRFVAAFPNHVKQSVQYGLTIKAHAVYLSQYQLIPYDRIRDHFADQIQMPISAGSVFNFNQDA